MARDMRRLNVRRIAIAAVEEAFDQLEESKQKKRNRPGLPAKGALITGAALATAGRVAWSSRGRGMLGSLEQRLSGLMDHDGPAEPEDEEEFYEPEDEEAPEAHDEEEYDEEPEGLEEEESEGLEEEEPEGEGEEGFAEDEAGHDEDEEPEEESVKPQRRSRAGSRNKRRS